MIIIIIRIIIYLDMVSRVTELHLGYIYTS